MNAQINEAVAAFDAELGLNGALLNQLLAQGRARLEGEAGSLIQLELTPDEHLLLAVERAPGEPADAWKLLAAAHWRSPNTQLQPWLALRGPRFQPLWVLAWRLDVEGLRQMPLSQRLAQLQEALA
jgi:hypothetical protein